MTAARTSLLKRGHAFTISARSETFGVTGVLSGVSAVDRGVGFSLYISVSTVALLPSSLFARSVFGGGQPALPRVFIFRGALGEQRLTKSSDGGPAKGRRWPRLGVPGISVLPRLGHTQTSTP